MKNERVLKPGTEAGCRPGDVDCAVVRRDRRFAGCLAAPAVKLFVEQQIAVRAEFYDQGRDVSRPPDGLEGARHIHRPVRRDRQPAAWIYDVAC